jgi:hypothetical protein
VNIRTKQTGDRIVAKGNGKQRTVVVLDDSDFRRNHREAAQNLADVFGLSILPGTHTVEADKGTARFVIPS